MKTLIAIALALLFTLMLTVANGDVKIAFCLLSAELWWAVALLTWPTKKRVNDEQD